MADSTILPGQRAALVDRNGVTSPEFYRFFRSLSPTFNLPPRVDDLTVRIVTLEDERATTGNVVGKMSIVSAGILSNGLVTVRLDGDIETAPALSFYGALTEGVKGWQTYSANFEALDNGDDTSSLDLADTGVTAGTYGSPSPMLVAFQVDSKGRLVDASSVALIAGNGISFDTDPDTGAITISVNSFVPILRITQDGSTRTTRAGNFRATR